MSSLGMSTRWMNCSPSRLNNKIFRVWHFGMDMYSALVYIRSNPLLSTISLSYHILILIITTIKKR